MGKDVGKLKQRLPLIEYLRCLTGRAHLWAASSLWVSARYQGRLVCMGEGRAFLQGDSCRGPLRLCRYAAGGLTQRHLFSGHSSQRGATPSAARRTARQHQPAGKDAASACAQWTGKLSTSSSVAPTWSGTGSKELLILLAHRIGLQAAGMRRGYICAIPAARSQSSSKSAQAILRDGRNTRGLLPAAKSALIRLQSEVSEASLRQQAAAGES